VTANGRTYTLDSSHMGIRIAVLLAVFAGSILAYFAIVSPILRLFNTESLPVFCISTGSSLLIGLGIGWAAERGLRRIWPSGEWLRIEAERLATGDRDGEKAAIRWADRINILSWYFEIHTRRAPVPKGWYCMACHLLQDEHAISVYTFIKPEIAEEFPQWPAFEKLISQKRATRRGDADLLNRTGEQGQLRAAEQERWATGREMQPDDFANLLAELDKRVSHWPRATADEAR
jgi:hypothetical protein